MCAGRVRAPQLCQIVADNFEVDVSKLHRFGHLPADRFNGAYQLSISVTGASSGPTARMEDASFS